MEYDTDTVDGLLDKLQSLIAHGKSRFAFVETGRMADLAVMILEYHKGIGTYHGREDSARNLAALDERIDYTRKMQ